MPMSTAAKTRETETLIGSDKVEGTNVYRSNGDKVGSIERVEARCSSPRAKSIWRSAATRGLDPHPFLVHRAGRTVRWKHCRRGNRLPRFPNLRGCGRQ